MLVSIAFTAASADCNVASPLVNFNASRLLTLAQTFPVCATNDPAVIKSIAAAIIIPFVVVLINFMAFCVCFMKQRKPHYTA